MNSKRIFFIMALMLTTSLAFSQSKAAFAVLGGVNFQNLNGKDIVGNKFENDMLLGFHGGVNVQLPVAPEIFFQPGLLYSIKGAKMGTDSYKLSYVELPLNVVYKALLGKGYFLLGFGPYVAYGIGGKFVPETGTTSDIKFKKSYEVGDLPYRVFKPFDAGGNLFFGYEMASGIFAQLDSQLGMLNILPENTTLGEATLKNTGFGLSLGYRF